MSVKPQFRIGPFQIAGWTTLAIIVLLCIGCCCTSWIIGAGE